MNNYPQLEALLKTYKRFLVLPTYLLSQSVNGLMVRILPFQGRGPGSIPG